MEVKMYRVHSTHSRDTEMQKFTQSTHSFHCTCKPVPISIYECKILFFPRFYNSSHFFYNSTKLFFFVHISALLLNFPFFLFFYFCLPFFPFLCKISFAYRSNNFLLYILENMKKYKNV